MATGSTGSRTTGSNTPVRRNKRASLTRTWLVRVGIALGVGLLAGTTVGVVGVNTLEPARPQQADSLQLMLDSIAKGQSPAKTADSIASTADNDDDAGAVAADSASAGGASGDSAVSVPDVVGVEEGAARTSLAASGLVVGSTEFRASRSPAGTVLTTLPVFGAQVKRGTAVSLVLSDGRAPADSTSVPGFTLSP